MTPTKAKDLRGGSFATAPTGLIASGQQQLAIRLAFQTRPLSSVRFIIRKAVPEIERQALIEQNLHAILASNESFASSRA
jgi:hypothetical protein